MKRTFLNARAFTLVELLVVIAIIALLTAIITVNFATSKSKARDGQRIANLTQIQSALGFYFDRCNVYPPSITGDPKLITDTSCPPGITLDTFISKIPTPPTGTTYTSYDYQLPTSPQPHTDYVLRTVLESKNAQWMNSLGSSAPSFASGLDCGNSSQVNFCVGPKL